ncbi:hypothetical protein GUJ93_ZPchr0002g25547 [Zizania palustris]|uniref:Protein kinase domain-containing protein n=1 Tax=Zizania palustris TaxID=103762 RepID=A0A8J5RPY5_ZIZPA|nr:hypothetical protein GUJ93_ZPchr0002g25547 [Zizania palustris]
MAAFPLILTAVVLCSAFASASGFTNPADELVSVFNSFALLNHDDVRDVSFNNIAGEIPPNLPPNVEYLQQVRGSIPPSLLWLHSLKYLNLSNNKLSGIIGDVFVNMERLGTMYSSHMLISFSSEMNQFCLHFDLQLHVNYWIPNIIQYLDLSFNSFCGDLPTSFSLLKNLHHLYLQHNEFTGSVILLAGLPLSTLFSGYVPGTFESIPELRIDGNQFQPVPKANEVLYSWSSLMTGSTRDFSKEYLIGEGFTGQVYRGDFPDGQLLAIKKINMVDLSLSEQDDLIDMLGKMSTATRSRALSWKARMKIALGVAYALEFMHQRCSPPVVHGNIKSTNILLDAQLMPYLSHCGLAKLSRFVSTIRTDLEALSSAKGYAAPETTDPSIDNIKADIYSFGVILLVLLTGQKAFDRLDSVEQVAILLGTLFQLNPNRQIHALSDAFPL